MNVLITGALGWLGKALSEVVSRDHTVRAFDLEMVEVPRETLDFDVEVMYGSVTDFETMQAAVQGQDAVIHAAVTSTITRGLYDPGDPVPFDVNVRGTYNVLEAARQAGVERIILIVSAETHVDHPPGAFVDRSSPYYGRGSIYDLTKRLQEEIGQWFSYLFGLEVIALRLGDVIDADLGRTKRKDTAITSWQMIMDTHSWVHRYDVGEACLRALQIEHKGFDIYHLIGAPEAKKRFDVARAEGVFGFEFTTDFDRRPANERE